MAVVVPRCLRRAYSKSSLSLIVLVVQNSLLVVMTRFSRNNVLPEDNYYTSTLILNQETVKMVMCLVIFAFDEALRGNSDATAQAKVPDGSPTVVVQVEDGDASGRASARPFGARDGTDDVVRVNSGDDSDSETRLLKKSDDDKRGGGGRSGRLRFLTASQFLRRLRVSVFKQDTMLLLLPQMLFTMQNFLIFVGLSNLDAVSFQIWSQTKLLSAALFSVWLLHRRLSWPQWLSLALLTVGVLVTQLTNTAEYTKHISAAMGNIDGDPNAEPTTTTTTTTTTTVEPTIGEGRRGNPLLGIAACVLSGLSSSYAGVYFEKVVKTTSPTLAIRNIQLSIFGIPLAFLSMLVLDVLPNWRAQAACGQPWHWNIFLPPPEDWKQQYATATARTQRGSDVTCPVKPFFAWQHYDVWLTWGLVGIHALGGLLVAIVVRYADNILKGFATGIAVIVSGLMSSAIWGYEPTLEFVLGAVLVTASTVMFHKFEIKREALPPPHSPVRKSAVA